MNEIFSLATTLINRYDKIIKVNLQTNLCETLKDTTEDGIYSNDFKEWWTLVGNSKIYEEDKEKYNNFLKDFNSSYSIYYRRFFPLEKDYKWCFAQKVLCEDNCCYILLKALDDDCVNTVVDKMAAERYAYKDNIFDCFTINKYNKDMNARDVEDIYTLIYLKFVKMDSINSKYGLTETNRMINYHGVSLLNEHFGKENIYHISGLKFLIYLPCGKRDIIDKNKAFLNDLKDCKLHVISAYTEHIPKEKHLTTFKKAQRQLKELSEKNKY